MRGRFQLISGTLPRCPSRHSGVISKNASGLIKCSPDGVLCWNTQLYAGHVPEESKSPTPSPRLHVLQVSTILNLCICYIAELADPEYAAQAAQMEGLQDRWSI